MSFTPYQKIGEGSFSEVWTITETTAFVMKKYKTEISRNLLNFQYMENKSIEIPKYIWQLAVTEYRILKKLKKCDNIVTVKNFVPSHRFKSGQQPICLMERILGNTLDDKIKGGNDIDIHKFLLDMINALQYMKQNRVVHLDLKPENIMIENDTNRAVIIDFGSAVCHDLENNFNYKPISEGTILYSSPNRTEQMYKNLDEKDDIWSLGTIVYEILYKQPFIKNNSNNLYHKNTRIKFKKTSLTNVNISKKINIENKQLEHLLIKMLTLDKSQRITLEQIETHPFMLQNSFSKEPLNKKLNSKLGGKKKYIKLKNGNKRLIRYGQKGGKYYLNNKKKIYIKNLIKSFKNIK